MFQKFCLSTESFRRGTLLFQKNSRIEKFYAKGGNITIFYWKSVVSEYRKNFVGETFCVSQNFWYRKTLWIRGGGGGGGREYHDFMSKFLSHSTESVRRGTLLCLRKFHVSKNFMFKKRISRFSIEKLLSHSTEKFRRGTLLCFRSFVSVPNHFVEESLRQKVSPIEKFYA